MKNNKNKNSSNRCNGKTSKGVRCKGYPTVGSEYCFFHDPKKKNTRRKAQQKGGKTKIDNLSPTNEIEFTSLIESENVRKLLSDTIHQLLMGNIDDKKCRTIGYLAQVTLKSIELATVEKRLTEVESIIDKMEFN
ncbi:MAG: hypothetical protein DRP47_07720 [Candidatus Zixiibacteriota bacterium]|nr:MAG: hypothetical protein DRP47_07720 [candidate division Zixibacteria bacterium]